MPRGSKEKFDVVCANLIYDLLIAERDRILARLTFPGALYLAAVAALPTILINQTGSDFYFGGTSLLIVVGVALDTVKQMEAQLMMRSYDGFLRG
jgi:preprotein translocase subunit SecY